MNDKERQLHYLCQKYDPYNFPLYFSYPVDGCWEQGRMGKKQFLDIIKIDEADLYVHFPYCKTVCYYCCCDKLCTSSSEEIDKYLNNFDQELAIKFDSKNKIKITSMHWGGGTPTYMSINQISHMMDSIKKYFDIMPEAILNLEAYPDEELVTEEKLKHLYALGFHSISFGIQDFNVRVQKAINRWCTEKTAQKIIDMVKKIGFEVHVDLCYGLPYQGLSEFENTVKVVKNLSPDKVVIYAYAHYPYTYPLQRNIPMLSLPNIYMKLLMMDVAKDILNEEYVLYGMDTFVKKDGRMKHWEKETVIRNFMGASSNKDSHLIGIGMSAVSKLNGVYFKNHTDMKRYKEDLEKGVLPIEKYYAMTQEDNLRHYVIQKQILSDFMIRKKEIEELYNINFDKHFASEMEILKKFVDEGIVTDINQDVIKLTEYGRYFSRLVAYIFDTYYTNKEKLLNL